MKKLILAFLMLVASVAFAAPQYGGTLVFGRGGDSSTIDPAHATDGEILCFYTSV